MLLYIIVTHFEEIFVKLALQNANFYKICAIFDLFNWIIILFYLVKKSYVHNQKKNSFRCICDKMLSNFVFVCNFFHKVTQFIGSNISAMEPILTHTRLQL